MATIATPRNDPTQNPNPERLPGGPAHSAFPIFDRHGCLHGPLRACGLVVCEAADQRIRLPDQIRGGST